MRMSRLRHSIDLRKRDGLIFASVAQSIRLFRKDPSMFAFFRAVYHIVCYGFGDGAAYFLIRKPAQAFGVFPRRYLPAGDVLYHWTPKENIETILREGLRSRSGRQIFMTDDADFVKGSLKEHHERKTGHPVQLELLSIDAQKLCQTRSIYYNGFRVHEFLTDSVPPLCIQKTGIVL